MPHCNECKAILDDYEIETCNACKKDAEPKVISASISAKPKSMFDPMPKVTVTLDDDTEVELFEYYPDEISFTENEFVGLTLAEASHLKFVKDKAYLQS